MQGIKKQNTHKKTPLFSLTNRFVLFLLGFILVVFSFYVVGNWQLFLDENQKLLLLLMNIISIILLVFLLIGFVLIVTNVIKTRSIYFVKYILLYIVYILFTVILFLFSNFITFISR